jgi:hypothetical protein
LETDATKRARAAFGNPSGGSPYDRERRRAGADAFANGSAVAAANGDPDAKAARTGARRML